jgi:hypothetical protein
MDVEPQATCYPRGLEDEFRPDDDEFGPPTVVITHRGFKLVLRFAEGDFMGEGLVEKIELLPDTEELKLGVLRRLAPDAELYLAYARYAMRIFGPEGTPEGRITQLRDSAEALRALAKPSRRLSNGFYKTIALEYNALIDGGEKSPVTALAEKHGVVISAASHWLREARARKLLPEKKKGGRNAR